MNQRVLVTGASGFIASHTIIQLLHKGYRVRGTLRSLSRAEDLKQTLSSHADTQELEFVAADLESDEGWTEAVANCELVLHIASPLPRVMPKDRNALVAPARVGALRVIRAAEAAACRRLVMTASTACIAYGRGNTDRVYTEADWSDPDGRDNSPYTRSKTLAERAAWEYVNGSDSELEFLTINPGAVLGPVLEKDYGTSAEIVLKLMAGDFPGLPLLGFPLVDVRDVADLHIRAMESDKAPGNRFLCANDFMWMEDIAALLREKYAEYHNRIPQRKLPNFLVRLAALADPVTRGVIFELGVKREVDSSRAKNLLGWSPRSNEEAILATAESLIAMGLV